MQDDDARLHGRGNGEWDKQHGVDVERARLLKHTRELVAKGQQAEHIWHAATHVEHVRPMLQVRSWQSTPPQSTAIFFISITQP